MRTCLSIAGSDSGGGAGIQADLKAFARCGVHGMTAITALTAQNTMGVSGIYPVAAEFIVEQVRTVAENRIGILTVVRDLAQVESEGEGRPRHRCRSRRSEC